LRFELGGKTTAAREIEGERGFGKRGGRCARAAAPAQQTDAQGRRDFDHYNARNRGWETVTKKIRKGLNVS